MLLDDVSSVIFACVLEFLYEGRCTVEETAARLQVLPLQDAVLSAR